MPKATLWVINIFSILLLLSLSLVSFGQDVLSVSIDTSPLNGTPGKLVFDFINNNPGDGNNVKISAFSAPGATFGPAGTQGGPVSGDLLHSLNPAPLTTINSNFFFNELSVNFSSFSNNVTFTLQVSEIGPPAGNPPAQFAFFMLDSSGFPSFPTSDPLGADALFTIDATGAVGGTLNTFSPARFIPPNSIHISVPGADTVPPVSVATASPTANPAGWNNTNVAITINSTDDPSGSGVEEIDFSLAGAQTGSGKVTGSSATVTISAEGITTLTFFAIDNAGNQEAPNTIIVRIDKTPPTIAGLPANCSLFPPNHKLIDVAMILAADTLSGIASFDVTGSSNEPFDPANPDIVIFGANLDPRDVQLRAERLGTGNGRVYGITATASDIAGNITMSTATCVVPHDQGNN
jgi:hypothetical protein